MRWRRGPRAAVAPGAIGAAALVAFALSACAPAPPDATPSRAEHAAAGTEGASRPSINDTLTLDADGCARVPATSWHPLSGIEYTGGLRMTLPPSPRGSLVLFVGDEDLPLAVVAETLERQPVPIERTHLPPGPGLQVPPDFWLGDSTPWDAPRFITRVAIAPLPLQERTLILWLGRRAPRVLARLEGVDGSTPAIVCAAALPEDKPYFATGWYGEEPTAEGPVRWMQGQAAVLIAGDGAAATVRVRAAAAIEAPEAATWLTLRVNDTVVFPPRRMQKVFADYAWQVPASAWVDGANELFFSVSETSVRDRRTLGLALASLHIE